MKRVGILFGQEDTFPQAFIERVNAKQAGVVAEPVKIDKLIQGEPTAYDVIIDRISQDVPFYRAYLKNAALNGTAALGLGSVAARVEPRSISRHERRSVAKAPGRPEARSMRHRHAA